MKQTILRGLLPLCYLGIGASFVLHLLSLVAGETVPTAVVVALHVGIFAVAIPTALIVRGLTAEMTRQDHFQLVKRASPLWLRRLATIGFAYFAVVFVVFAATHRDPPPAEQFMPAGTLVMFSAGWLVGYAAMAMEIFAGLRAGSTTLRCPNGHRVSPTAQFCAECGSRV